MSNALVLVSVIVWSVIFYLASTRALLGNYHFMTTFISGAITFIDFRTICKLEGFLKFAIWLGPEHQSWFGDRYLEPFACVELSGAIWNTREPYESLGVSWGHLEHAYIYHHVSFQESFQEVPRKADQASGEHLTQHILKWRSTYPESRWTPILDWLIVGALDTTNDDKARHTCVDVYVFLPEYS